MDWIRKHKTKIIAVVSAAAGAVVAHAPLGAAVKAVVEALAK